MPTIISDISIEDIEISEFNTRKDLADGQSDSTIEDLAKSIQKQGLISPITIFQKPDGLYSLVSGQRRLIACTNLGWSTIPSIIRDAMSSSDAIAVSLVENLHRADMNPRDKAVAFKALVDKMGSAKDVSRETGVGAQTIRKYLSLLALAPQLQERLAAGEVKGTTALSRLAQKFPDPSEQIEISNKISGFRQDEQIDIIKRVDPDLENLDPLVDQGAAGLFGARIVRNCPFDCPTIPEELKDQVAQMIKSFKSE